MSRWRQLASATVEVRDVDCSHDELLVPPAVATTGRLIRQLLDAAST